MLKKFLSTKNGSLITKQSIAVCVILSVIFAIISGLSFTNLPNTIVGSGPDPYQYIWNADVFSNALLNGTSPFFTDRLAYPEGVSLWMHTYTPIIGMTNVFIGNPYLSCNLILWLSFVLSGLGAFLLARRYVDSFILCFLVGFVFSFSPYKTSHLLEHYHLLLTATVPIFIILLLRVFPEGKVNLKSMKWFEFLGLLALGIVTMFSDYYTTFYLLYAFIGYFGFYLLRRLLKNWSLKKRWFLVLGVFIVGHAIIEPIKINSKWDDKGAMYNTADLISVVTPAENSKVYGPIDVFKKIRGASGYKGPNEQVMFFGFVLFVLLLLSFFYKGTREQKLWSFLVFFFLALSLPKIKFIGTPISYSPTAILHYFPFLNNIRNPSRAVVMVYLFLPLVIAIFLEQTSKLKWSKYRTLMFAGITLITMVEYWPQEYPTIQKSSVNTLYSNIQEDDSVKVIWEIPTGMQDGLSAAGQFDIVNLQEQIEHKKKLLGGYISRLDSSYLLPFLENPVYLYVNDLADIYPEPSHTEMAKFLEHYTPQLAVVKYTDPTKQAKMERLLSPYSRKFMNEQGAKVYYFKEF
jgi:hypothetical protein